MSWRDRLETASFRGIEFLTDSHDSKGGRRLVVKQYPGSEIAEVEDLGGKAGEFRLNAYFIGADYDLACNAFMAVLNKAGADWLTHPWLGKIWVRARDWSRHESNKEGGTCTLSIDFVPGGGDVAAPTADRTDIAVAARKKFADTAQAEFALKPMSAASMTSMIASVQGQLDRIRNVISLATLPLTMMSQVRNVIDGVKNDIAALMALPAQYAAQLRSFSDLLGGTDTSSGASTSVPATGVTQVVDNVVSMALAPVPMPGGVGDYPALHINLTAESKLRSYLLLASAAQVALADYQSADDRDAALASVLSAMDMMLPTMSDPVFQAALDCRAALIDALLAQDLEPSSVRDIVQPLPATLLAHRMEVDEAVFLARNKVRHPLFVRGRVYG
jgi:prophage DNA circulation protein